MDAELGHPTKGNSTRRTARLIGAGLAVIGVSALAIGAAVSQTKSSVSNVDSIMTDAANMRVARQAPSSYPTPVYTWDGSNSVIASWDWATATETPTSTKHQSSTTTTKPHSKTTTAATPTPTDSAVETASPQVEQSQANSESTSDYVKPEIPPFDTPAVSSGGDKGGKSNISTKKPANIYAGQSGGAVGQSSPCECDGAVVGGVCYSTVAQAVGAASSGDTVSIGGTKTISSPIGIRAKSLNFEGVACGGQKAKLVADMNEPTGAILMPGGSEHEITLKDLEFTRAPSAGFASGLRAYNDKAKISLDIQNCDFINLRTKAAGGSALYVPFPVKMNVDGSSTFKNNIVDTRGAGETDKNWFYGGGGAIYILELSSGREVTLDGEYSENHHYFQHGLGGAVCVEYVEGTLNIVGKFIKNTAADGAGVHIEETARAGVVNIDGYFQENRAIDYGLGCRGGAVRPWMVFGTINARGTYVDNRSDGRGAVFATNRLYKSGKMNISGTYKNNIAVGMGAIFSLSNEAVGTTFVSGSSTFTGNEAICSCANILDIQPGKFQLSESEWTGQDVTYSAPRSTTKAAQE